MIASAAAVAVRADRPAASAGMPAAIGSMSSGWPMTPVEATTTSSVGHAERICARAAHIASAISMPLALQVLALPLLQTIAWRMPSARCCLGHSDAARP